VSPVVIVLVLASAVVHATWNLWAKELRGEYRDGALMWTLTAISAVAYAPLALWTLSRGGWRPDAAAAGFIAASGVIHVLYFLLLLRGYRSGDLSVVYPVARGTGPMVSALAALALFHERPTAGAFTGLALIVVGVLVLTGAGTGAHSSGGRLAAGLRHGIGVGLLIAVYTLWDGWSVKRAGIPPLVFYWGGEVTRVLLFTPAAAAAPGEVSSLWRRHRWRVLGIALLSPASYMLVLLAMRMGPVSRIAPARELSIVLGAWLGGSVLGEGDRGRRLAASLAFAAGVIALAVG
jgi:drug/metabolite transporter (DMT)-like permease